jgi:hypothetical protein
MNNRRLSKRNNSIILLMALCVFTSLNFTLYGQKLKWYKGNTHTHTTLSDGNASPEYVVSWYHERGYNFLSLTDHNKFINPDSVKLPENKRSDFILIPGEEVTGKRTVHTTGLNVNRYIHPGYEFNSVEEVIQCHTDSILSASGIPILNHPNFRTGAQVDDILPVQRLHMLELFNGHPKVDNWGAEGVHIAVEAKWDSLLTHGQRFFAVAADDAHHFDEFYPQKSNPARGWIMVHCSMLTAGSIVASMKQGNFYASNGVILKTIEKDQKEYTVEIDIEATREELKSPYLTGNIVEEGNPGFVIEFIGKGGEVLNKAKEPSATYKIKGNELYIRCRVTYCRKRSENMYENLYAWTQPIFVNEK